MPLPRPPPTIVDGVYYTGIPASSKGCWKLNNSVYFQQIERGGLVIYT